MSPIPSPLAGTLHGERALPPRQDLASSNARRASSCDPLTCLPALARLEHPPTQDLKIMNAPARTALMDVTTQELEYQRIGGKAQLARLYRPKGDGPFPAVVGVHGGAWT